MKVKWKQQEKLFVATLVGLLLLKKIGHVIQTMGHDNDRRIIDTISEFLITFLTQITPTVFLFLCYLGIVKYLVPVIDSLYSNKTIKEVGGKILHLSSWVFLFSYLLGPGNNFLLFYLGIPYEDFSSAAFYHPQPFRNLFGGLGISFSIVLLYSVYVLLRNLIIGLLRKRIDRAEYRLQILNLVTTFLFLLIVVAFYFLLFRSPSMHFWIPYIGIIPFVFLMGLCSIYWIFPLNKTNSFFSFKFIKHLLLAIVISMLPALLMDSLFGGSVFIMNLGLLFFVLPTSWAIYKQQADAILKLRGTEKELVKSKANIQFLRSQINPHFLFNALNTLYGTAIVEKSERTAEGIQRLGDMMRFMLHDNHQDFIPMSRELDYLKNYIALQKLRIASSPEIVIEDVIEEKYSDHLIAPMLLIPFVENAFKHGISFRAPSWIKIKLYCDEGRIHFFVSNSVHSNNQNDPEKDASGIGIQNVKERLNLLYPNQYDFTYSDDKQNCQVVLSLPLKSI